MTLKTLLYRYAELVDAGEFSAVAQLLREATLHGPDNKTIAQGYDEIFELYQQTVRCYPKCGTPRTRHLTSNLILDIAKDEESANGRSCFTVLQQTTELPLQVIVTGRYHDEFRFRDKQWYFARRQMILDFAGNMEHHILPDARYAAPRKNL